MDTKARTPPRLHATAVVWIAPTFADEHMKALDRLNDHTSEDLAFFGVQIELWQIDDSRPAVRFNVISRPAGIVREAAARKAQGELTPTRELQLEWWTRFRDALQVAGFLPSLRTPAPQYWYDIALGRSGIHLSNTANVYEGKIGVRVYLNQKSGGDQALDQLLGERAEIEAEIGAELVWNPRPENRDKVIMIERDVDLEDQEKWAESLDWMVDMTRRFREAFGPRVRRLDLDRSSVATD